MRISFTKSGRSFTLGILAAGALAACGGSGGSNEPIALNQPPADLIGEIRVSHYDGVSDDLLTAGLGASGLQSATPPAFADPLAPTPVELRRAAIYHSYRALVDTSTGGGYGLLYGPQLDAQGNITASEGRIAGTEYLARATYTNVLVLAQVPDNFNPDAPCIIAAASSGSRGIYGAISTGEWGLKRGCAVAYTDKGTGSGPHDLQNGTVSLIDGTRGTAIGNSEAHFASRLRLLRDAYISFRINTPWRFAFKHAHSEDNPEKDWGHYTLQAVRLALYAINDRFAPTNAQGQRTLHFTPENTLVIASSVSNGGGAAIAAAELDTEGLIDGLAVAEPSVQLPPDAGVKVQRGDTVHTFTGRNLFDFITHANLYQACAALALPDAPYGAAYAASFNSAALPIASHRCQALRARGLLSASATSTQAQAQEALQRMLDYGWEPESLPLMPSHAAFEIAPAVSVTYANALSRSGVQANLCNYSFAATDATGQVVPLAAPLLAAMSASGNGIPPTGGISLVYTDLRDYLKRSPEGLYDWSLSGALCLRGLLSGNSSSALKLQAGMPETQRNGRLGGKPGIIVHGRDDALLPVNHTSRPYYALNQRVEGSASQLRYIEVTNAQHFDSFIGLNAVLPGYDTRYIPLHVYLNRALDAVYAHLNTGEALPPSQLVRTVPRGGLPGQAPAISAANVPPFAAQPAEGDLIRMADSHTLVVPD